MNNYSWIIDRLKLTHGQVKQVGSEVVYHHKNNFQFKINVDIEKLAEVSKEWSERKQYKDGEKREGKTRGRYKTKPKKISGDPI